MELAQKQLESMNNLSCVSLYMIVTASISFFIIAYQTTSSW